MNKQVTKWRVHCSFFPDTGLGFGDRRRVSLQGNINGRWLILVSYMKRDDVDGMRMFPNHVEEIDGDSAGMLWYGQGRDREEYPVPDGVFKEIFHLLYTVEHPQTEHSYTSIEYEPVKS